MKLVSLTLSNFRCFRDETRIAFDDLTAIIGENDVGKSSALEALEVFFNSDVVKIENGDLSVTAEDNIVTITCEFTDLPQLLVLDAQAETSLGEEYLLASTHISHINPAGLAVISNRTTRCSRIAEHCSYHEC